MNQQARIHRAGRVRVAVLGLVALALGGMLASVISVPAFAASSYDVRVELTTPAGAPVTGAEIFAYQLSQGVEAPDDPAPEAAAITGEPGYYVFSGSGQLLAGPTYTLGIVPTGTSATTSFSQLLGGATLFDQASTFTVGTTAGSVTSVSASLANSSVISGTVLGPTGKPLKGARVKSYTYAGSDWYDRSFSITNASGEYSLTNIVPGNYRLEVYPSDGVYQPAFSGGASTFDTATTFEVPSGSALVENVTFPHYSGSLFGVSTYDYEDLGSAPMAEAIPAAYPITAEGTNGEVTAVDLDRAVYGSRSSASGKWSIGDLAPGEYVVELFPWYENESAAYAVQGGSSYDLSGAQIFQVGSGQTDTGWSDFYTGQEGGSLTVTVDDSSDSPVINADVVFARTSDPSEYYEAMSNEHGVVQFGQSGKNSFIRPGQFTLTVLAADNQFEPYVEQYDLYPGASSLVANLITLQIAPGFSVAPYIAQTATQLGTQYVVTATAARSDATLSYQWLRNGEPIYGANSASYVSRTADLGDQLSVRVSAASDFFDTVFATATMTGVVTDSNVVPLLVSPPALSPSDGSIIHAGTLLNASPGTWSVSGLTFSYQWFEDGSPISTAGNRYLVTAADIGHVFSVQVIATRLGYPDAAPATASNTITPTAGPATSPLTPISVSTRTAGLPSGTRSYTVEPGMWAGLDPSFSYTWRLGQTVVCSNSPTYVEAETSETLSEPLTVRVSAIVAGFQPGSASVSAREATVALTPLVQPFATLGSGGSAVGATSSVAFGQTLTVGGTSVGLWPQSRAGGGAPIALSFTFQWFRAAGHALAKAIPGATSASYSPVSGDLGDHLSFIETVHSSEWADGVSDLIPAGIVVGSDALVDSPLTMGMPALIAPGVYISPDYGDQWDSVGASTTYQWYLCAAPSCTAGSPTSAFTKIAHATENYYVPTAIEGGDRLFLEAIGSKTAYVTAQAVSSVVQVAPSEDLLEDAPFITADSYDPSTSATVGQTITPHIALLQNDDAVVQAAQYSFAWQVCSTDCSSDGSWSSPSGAVTSDGESLGTSFTPNGTDYGTGSSMVRVTETVSEVGFLDTVVTSSPIPIVQGNYLLGDQETPQLVQTNGDSDTSETFTISAPKTALGVAPTYQWYVGDVAVAGASVLVDNPSQDGTPVYVVVTYDLPGYTPFTRVLVARYAPVPTVTAEANSIVGDTYGQTLTVTNPDPWELQSYPGVPWVLSYQWCFGHECDTFRGNPNYTPTTYAIGDDISVEIDYSSAVVAGTLDQYNTPAVLLQEGAPFDPAASPQCVLGDLLAGTTVLVSTPAYAISGVSTDYNWQLSTDGGTTWNTVSDETDDTFTPTLAEAGEEVRAVVTGTEDGYPDSVHDSETETIQLGDIIQNLAAPTVTGNPTVDSTLAVDSGSWSHDVSLQTQWLLNGEPIPGETGSTYVLQATDWANEISVDVTASRAGQLPLTVESNRMTIGLGAAPVATGTPVISGSGTLESPLVVTNGAWSGSGLIYTYQWSDQSGDIAGATTNSLVLTNGDVRSDVSVVITASRPGYYSGEATAS